MEKTIKTKYLVGFLEDRKEMLKNIHASSKDSKEQIQMLCRIDEIDKVLKEIKNIENIK